MDNNDLKAQAMVAAREAMTRKRREARRAEVEELQEKHAQEIQQVEKKHDAIITSLQKVVDDAPEALVELHEMATSILAEAMTEGTVANDKLTTVKKRYLAQADEEGANVIDQGNSISAAGSKGEGVRKIVDHPEKKRKKRESDVDASDMSFCKQVLKKITGPRYRNITHPFYEAVDWHGLGLWTYPTVVPHGKDLSMIRYNLINGAYHNPRAFKADLDLMIENCVRFSGRNHAVSGMAKSLSTVIDFMWRTGTTPDEIPGVICLNVEKILKHKHEKRGQVLYQVMWLGYDDPKYHTWEPAGNLGDSGELQVYLDDIGGEPAPKPSAMKSTIETRGGARCEHRTA